MLLVAKCAKYLAANTDAAVLLIHHPNKGDATSLRGHSSLSGAVDTIISISSDEATGIRTATLTKLRDSAAGIHIEFQARGHHPAGTRLLRRLRAPPASCDRCCSRKYPRSGRTAKRRSSCSTNWSAGTEPARDHGTWRPCARQDAEDRDVSQHPRRSTRGTSARRLCSRQRCAISSEASPGVHMMHISAHTHISAQCAALCKQCKRG